MRTIEQYLDHVEIMNTMEALVVCLLLLNIALFLIVFIISKDDKPKDDDGAI